MILQRAVIVGHFVEENVPVQWILFLVLIFALIDLLPHTILQFHVAALLLDKLVELDWLVELISCVGFWWFLQRRLPNFIHHLAVLGRKLVFDFALKFRLILL